MTQEKKRSLSKDHAMEREGVAWEDSVAEEDFSPYMPREEFEFRVQRAKALLARHGIDAMVLFAYGNKQYSKAMLLWGDSSLPHPRLLSHAVLAFWN